MDGFRALCEPTSQRSFQRLAEFRDYWFAVTVKEIVWDCVMLPDVAVMVSVDVPVGVPAY